MWKGFYFCSDRNSLKIGGVCGCTTEGVLNATELFTLKWLISCYVIFTSINYFSKNTKSLSDSHSITKVSALSSAGFRQAPSPRTHSLGPLAFFLLLHQETESSRFHL